MSLVIDEALGQIIRQRLQQDRRTSGAMVDVICQDGCICIMGHVDTIEQKDAALFIVEGLAGVKEVMDEIVVRQVVNRFP